MPHPFKILLLLALLLDTGCALSTDPTRSGSPSIGKASSADIAAEIAAEFGLPVEMSARLVPPSELDKYPIVVDVFRQSKSNPPLGIFRPEYVGILVPESSLPESERSRIAEYRFARLAQYEFAVVSQDGIPERLNLVSTGESLRDGNFRIGVVSRTTRLEAEDGPSVPVSIPFPWLRTKTLPDEPMTWGLWMHGGYFVQSTPYYANLGLPAINGGVHQSLPDSMELYSEAQLKPTVVRIHVASSDEASARLRELAPLVWIVEKLDSSRMKIDEVIRLQGPEIRLPGHGWFDPLAGDLRPALWPKCGVFDCFKSWNLERPRAHPLSTSL